MSNVHVAYESKLWNMLQMNHQGQPLLAPDGVVLTKRPLLVLTSCGPCSLCCSCRRSWLGGSLSWVPIPCGRGVPSLSPTPVVPPGKDPRGAPNPRPCCPTSMASSGGNWAAVNLEGYGGSLGSMELGVATDCWFGEFWGNGSKEPPWERCG